MSALGVERGARAVKERNIALLASVSGIGKKTAERLALELADKLGDFEEGGARGGPPPAVEPPKRRSTPWNAWGMRRPKRTGRCARRSRQTAAATRRCWCARPCNCSPTDDDARDG